MRKRKPTLTDEAPVLRVPRTGLDRRARQLWRQLAPHAQANGTLTEATAYSFALMCRTAALVEEMARTDPAGPSHRGLLKILETQLLRFNLAPNGKPMYEASVPAPARSRPPVNPLSKFLRRGPRDVA